MVLYYGYFYTLEKSIFHILTYTVFYCLIVSLYLISSNAPCSENLRLLGLPLLNTQNLKELFRALEVENQRSGERNQFLWIISKRVSSKKCNKGRFYCNVKAVAIRETPRLPLLY